MKVTRAQLIAQINDNMTKLLAEKPDNYAITAQDAYNLVIKTIITNLFDGNTVALNSFGTFTTQTHKGHYTNMNCAKNTPVKDYLVVKYSPSTTMIQMLREKHNMNQQDV